jgi:hypothetical protein
MFEHIASEVLQFIGGLLPRQTTRFSDIVKAHVHGPSIETEDAVESDVRQPFLQLWVVDRAVKEAFWSALQPAQDLKDNRACDSLLFRHLPQGSGIDRDRSSELKGTVDFGGNTGPAKRASEPPFV